MIQITLSFLAVFFFSNAVLAVEEAEYSIVLADGPFEVRKYEPHVLAETSVEGDFEDAGNKAFRRLFKFISGENKQAKEIAMTSPVGQVSSGKKIAMTSPVGQLEKDGKWLISFMMPATFTIDSTPIPRDAKISLRQVPSRFIAAIRYSGFWSEKNYLKNLDKLNQWIKENSYQIVGGPEWARYNPPFTPWFMRRNEVLIPVQDPNE